MSSLAERLSAIDSRIAARLATNGRTADSVTRIVVSKFHPASMVRELFDLGVRDFGENRDQEASAKAIEVAELELYWHFIGQLQSNKVKSVIEYASVIHSVDRQSLLDALIKQTTDREQALDVFVQVNLTDDPGRGGVNEPELLQFADSVAAAPGLNLLGLMAVASLDGEEERDFGRIANLSQLIQVQHPQAKYLSAGMSNDFELALDYGATHLRIGTAITGNREY
ncbi:MAG: YggS family pyridoxal phosphate-dependent enzyme [Rhodoluna sp.]|nr:YggS family pyridoxal phosphate-dependent enzyme [Rhodoluna sp.]